MTTITTTLIGLVAALHVYFLALEMFLWNTPYGRRVFGSTPEFAKAFELKIFFLTCVIVAGVYGGLTATRKILFVQALPAVVALVAVHIR